MKTEAEKLINRYIHLWNLIPDGELFSTNSSVLQPVMYKGEKSILKIPFVSEEKTGNKLMAQWNGSGAAKVFKWDENAILMERITGDYSLIDMLYNGQDDDATEIICGIAYLLHHNKQEAFPELIPLDRWFKDLFSSAVKYGGVITDCANLASELLSNQKDIAILHGDLHHMNVLHSSDRGWLAIDPKGLVGERTFDYVNIVCNPNKEIALAEGRMIRQIEVISNYTGINCRHLLKWTAAWAGLSAVWFLDNNMNADIPLGIAKLALKELEG